MTNSNLNKLLKRYHLELCFLPIEGEGYLVGKIVVVNNSLTEFEIENTILHEIGHAKYDPDVVGDCTSLPSAHSCSEHGANSFMIHEKVKEYVALGNDPDTANYVDIAVSLGIKDFDEVREELLRYSNNTWRNNKWKRVLSHY